ncbi:hypothetical protein ACJX0J_021202, partial [Zea mays]
MSTIDISPPAWLSVLAPIPIDQRGVGSGSIGMAAASHGGLRQWGCSVFDRFAVAASPPEASPSASVVNRDRYNDGSTKHSLLKQSSLDLLTIETPGLKKNDSFSRWMNKELEEVVDLGIKSTSDAFWSNIETVKVPDGSNVLTNEQLDAYVVNPSLSQDQLFSILDVSPSCAYIGTNTKVCKLFCALIN